MGGVQFGPQRDWSTKRTPDECRYFRGKAGKYVASNLTKSHEGISIIFGTNDVHNLIARVDLEANAQGVFLHFERVLVFRPVLPQRLTTPLMLNPHACVAIIRSTDEDC